MKVNVPINFVSESLFEGVEYVDGHAFNRTQKPGDARWIRNHDDSNDHAALQFICPCGCQSVHCITVKKDVKEERSWIWNGNVAKPSLQPSIQCLTPCNWHGYMTNGEFVPC